MADIFPNNLYEKNKTKDLTVVRCFPAILNA